jgi:hypothetical protein
MRPKRPVGVLAESRVEDAVEWFQKLIADRRIVLTVEVVRVHEQHLNEAALVEVGWRLLPRPVMNEAVSGRSQTYLCRAAEPACDLIRVAAGDL